MVFLKSRLARYEISIADWYLERDAYIAAINRAKVVLNTYPNTLAVEDALQIMILAYRELGLETPEKAKRPWLSIIRQITKLTHACTYKDKQLTIDGKCIRSRIYTFSKI